MRYLPDGVEHEIIVLPEEQLARIASRGSVQGDCDDAAALAGALARSIGLQTRIMLGSFIPSRRLHHVWAEALGQRGWVELDPFRAERLNVQATRLEPLKV